MQKNVELEFLLAELPPLRRFALALTRDADAADDLVQDCALRALCNLEKFEPGTNMRGWLFTIMRNLFCDQHRRRRRQGYHLPLDDAQDRLTQPAAQPARIRLQEVAMGFERLSAEQQQLIAMVGIDGESHEHAAEHFGVAVGTIKSRLSRARVRLRAHRRGIGRGSGADSSLAA
jgi:RNA polymerase sigma-70 factor (ECF subfamily)